MSNRTIVISCDSHARRLVIRLRKEGKPPRYAVLTLRQRPTVRWGFEPKREDLEPWRDTNRIQIDGSVDVSFQEEQ